MSTLLVYTENYGRGGGNRYLVDLINAVGAEYDEVVLCSNPGAIFAEDRARISASVKYREIGIITQARLYIEHGSDPSRFMQRLIGFAGTHDAWLFTYNRLLFRWLLRRVRPSAVLACNGGYPAARSTLALVVEAGTRVPTALSVVSTPYPRQSGAAGELERELDMRIWESARLVIANARMIGDMLEERRDAPPGMTHVVHNGLPSSIPEVLSSAHDRQLTIGCVARFDPEKGISALVEAFAELARTEPGIKLTLVGDGREHDAVVRQVADLGLTDRVSLPGHLDASIEDILGQFDIFAFPSIQEGLPYSVLEAMRSGRAIVSTDVGGIPEAITDGETGLLVPPSNPTAMAAALRRLIDDEPLRLGLARAARARFDSEFSLQAMSVRARQVFRDTGMSAS